MMNDSIDSPNKKTSKHVDLADEKIETNQTTSLAMTLMHDKQFNSSHSNELRGVSRKFDKMECGHSEGFNRFRTVNQSRFGVSSIAANICRDLVRQPGVHSTIKMKAAGFQYTDVRDCAKCDICQLEVSDWTLDMEPFHIHSIRSPQCSFVRSLQPYGLAEQLSSTTSAALKIPKPKHSGEKEVCKRREVKIWRNQCQLEIFSEVEILVQVRNRTFSIWPPEKSPSATEMVDAGFFHCNVSDRVLCIYCNLICQQWTSQKDDPWIVHKTLSPKCPYVINAVTRREKASVLTINDNSNAGNASSVIAGDGFHSHDIVPTTACHSEFIEMPERYESFTNWPRVELPNVDDLARAGFFYTGSKTIVTCFYCNGSLHNWGPNDNPTIEHARWFPYCPYAKQLCGPALYKKIQESQRFHYERTRQNSLVNRANSNTYKLEISDESTLSRYIAARLDLPISQRLLSQGFKISVIKRCWEDQLRLKKEEFVTDSDLVIACMILQKQIDGINGKKENIVVPSIKMKQILEQEQEKEATHSSPSIFSTTENAEGGHVSRTSNSESNSAVAGRVVVKKAKETAPVPTVKSSELVQLNTKVPDNFCALCMTANKQLACIPCGHFCACVPCGHSLRTCPTCRRQIQAFVRIYK